jgi:UDP-2,3-diacylglucosamine hydrolase
MPPKLGILAGRGTLPGRIAQTCRETGRGFFIIAFEGQTPKETVCGQPHAWVRLGAAGKAVKILHDEGAEELVMAGGMERPSLLSLMPDAWAARFLAKVGVSSLGDDGFLSTLIKELEKEEGFRFVALESILPDVLACEGIYGKHHPDATAMKDVDKGIEVARTLGHLDVGQGVVVQQGLVLALEAIEGTGEMLERCVKLRRDGPGGVLVKVAKPQQEKRVDLPTVGPDTVAGAHKAGLSGIAIEAKNSLVIDRKRMVEAADNAGLFVIGVSLPEDG